jgi:ATP-dependent Lon protease
MAFPLLLKPEAGFVSMSERITYSITDNVSDSQPYQPAYSLGDTQVPRSDDPSMGSDEAGDVSIPPNQPLPVLPLRNTVLFPGQVIPITVARDKTIHLIKDALQSETRLVAVVAQRNHEQENPAFQDLFRIGTLARILKQIRLPNGGVTVILKGLQRITLHAATQHEPYILAPVSLIPERTEDSRETVALTLTLKTEAAKYIELARNLPPEIAANLHAHSSLSGLVYFMSSNLPVSVTDKQAVLEENEVKEKAHKVLGFIARELSAVELSEELQTKIKTDIDRQQRDYFLRQQLKAIQEELGEAGPETEIESLRERGAAKKWPDTARQAFEKEVNKLYRINAASPEYSVALNYLDWMLDLPWKEYTKDRFNLVVARRILDKDHFGMEKVKDRILEYLAVLKLRSDLKAPILCLYGPPGVGKTSLGKSVARAIGRQFVRISLGGVRDEAEIRGHRRTYIGAMPGRILQGMKKAKSGNPVFLLDEVDKIGNDFRGDPSSALLEVLDPEQNSTFNDHYLELDYDLSTVMFIATANDISTIHPALRDRMELIEINGYTLEEKLQIALRHLIPKARKENGLEKYSFELKEEHIRFVIDRYTRESGVRNLAQKLNAIGRGLARDIVEKGLEEVQIGEPEIVRYLGQPKFDREVYEETTRTGVSIGLAWTSVGGEILFIETALMPGTGKLTLTGQLGDVMKESANIAWIYLRSHAAQVGIQPECFSRLDVHLHIPAGAIPKDGPSAGVSMLTALASALTGRLATPRVALTGEITLRGRVLPVGGIKEKVLAAVRAGITTIILSEQNRKDVSEIEAHLLQGLNFIFVDQMTDVLEHALLPEVVAPLVLPPVPGPAVAAVNVS